MAGTKKGWLNALEIGSSIATSIAGAVGGGFLLGRYLDERWRTQPWLTIILMLSGLILGGSYLVITLKNLGASDD